MMRRWHIWIMLPLMFCLMSSVGARAFTGDCTYPTTDIAFGQLDVFTQAPTAVGSVTITCINLPSDYSAKVCIRLKYLPSTYAYQLAPTATPTDYDLTYQIYTTDGRGTSWPQGTQDDPYGNLPFVLIPTNNTPVTQYFYATINPNQNWSKAGAKTAQLRADLRILTYKNTLPVPYCGDTLPGNTALKSTYVNVSAEVTPACNISATPMIFPSQTVITTDVLAENHLTIRCTMDTSYWVSLNDGQYDGGTGQRRMKKIGSSNDYINYDLFKDPARSSRWGLVVKGIDPPLATCNCLTGYSADHTVYGKIPKPQISPLAGSYEDKITATVDF